MNRKFRELFYVPDNGKVKDKVLMARGIATLCAIVLCLAGICVTAYAYFTAGVSSDGNRIKSAAFDLKVSVEAPAGVETPQINKSGDNYSVAFKANVPYSITLTRRGNAQTGFCVIKTVKGDYHTQQLGADRTARNQPVEKIGFTLILGADEVIIFQPHWGTSIHYPNYQNAGVNRYIIHGEKVTVGTVLPVPEPNPNEPDADLPEETTPEETIPEQTESQQESSQPDAPIEGPTEPENIPTEPEQSQQSEPDAEHSGDEQSDSPNEISP